MANHIMVGQRDGLSLKVQRDGVIDLARAGCLTIVVLFHGIMMGLTAGPAGWSVTNAFEGQGFFPVLSLFLQVMPLFFILGGFSSFGAWQRRQAVGVGPGVFVRERLLRLAKPAIMVFGAVGLGLTGLAVAGVPADLLGQIGFRISQPMWFLAVYLGCSAMVPFMSGLHRRNPRGAVAALAVAVLAIDALRQATGVDAIGLANLAFVWLLLQQIGFFVAGGERPERRALWLIFLIPLGVLLIGAANAWWPLDMLLSLNPPRFSLILLGLSQLGLMELLRPPLARLARRRKVAAASEFANAKSLTIYLWHASVMSVLLGLLLLLGAPMPEPLSPVWWATRPLWLLVLSAAVVAGAAALHRFEKTSAAPTPAPAPTAGRLLPPLYSGALSGRNAVAATVLAVAAVAVVLAAGSLSLSWLAATMLLAVSLAAVGTWRLPGIVSGNAQFRMRVSLTKNAFSR